MAKKPTRSKAKPTDADLLLKLYDLRREPVMRTAREFITTKFWPQSYDEFKGVATAFGSEHNAYLRQVLSYWDMAASLVLHGAIDGSLFFHSNGEPYFIYVKFKPFLGQIRKDMDNPEFLTNLEELANKTAESRERVKRLEIRMKAWGTQIAGAAKSHAAD